MDKTLNNTTKKHLKAFLFLPSIFEKFEQNSKKTHYKPTFSKDLEQKCKKN